MPDPLEREVVFDIDPALDALKDLDREFERVARNMEEVFTDAIESALGDIRVEDVDARVVEEEVSAAVEAGSETPAVISGDATEVVTAIESSVIAGAAAPAEISADASEVTPEIQGAIDAVNEVVPIEADTETVTDVIDAAIAAADTVIVINANTGPAEAAIGGLEGAEVEVAVTADTASADTAISSLGDTSEEASGEMSGLATAAAGVSSAASVTEGAVQGLGGAITGVASKAGASGIAIAALVGFTIAAGERAASSATQIERLNRTFGETAETLNEIDIKGFTGDLQDLAFATGSSTKNLRDAAADIGQFGQSAGFAQGEVADTAQQILLLASNAVALDPSLGDAGQAAERLRSALISGRERALAPFNIALDRSAVAARAQEIALAHGRSEISTFDKITAGAQLATEKFGDTIGTNLTNASQNAEIKLRQLQIRLSGILVTAGQPLIDPMIEAFEAAVPVIEALAQALGQLAGPTITALTPVFEGLGAVLGFVADIIEKIPEPILGAIGAFLVLRTATGALNSGLTKLNPALAASSGHLLALNIALAAGALAWSTFTADSKKAEEQAAAIDTALFGNAESASDLAVALSDLNEGFADYIKNSADFGLATVRILTAQDELGISNVELAKALVGSREEFDTMARTIVEATEDQDNWIFSSQETVDALEAERAALLRRAQVQLESLVASDQLSKKQKEQALAAAEGTGANEDYFEALRIGTQVAAERARAEEASTIATLDARDAWDDLRTAVIAGTDVDAGQWALDLGVDVDVVTDKINEFNEELESFATTALSALPTSSQAFSDWSQGIADTTTDAQAAFRDAMAAQQEEAELAADATDEQRVRAQRNIEETGAALNAAIVAAGQAASPEKLLANLTLSVQQIENFQQRLQTLIEQGFTDVAAFLVQQGPVAGGALAESLVDDQATTERLEGVIDHLDFAYGTYESFIRSEGGPQILTATEDAMGAAAQAGGAAFQLEEPTLAELTATFEAIEEKTPQLEGAMGSAGVRAAKEWQSRYVVDEPTRLAIDAAGNVIETRAPVTQSGDAGSRTADAYGNELDLPAKTKAEMSLAAQELFNTGALSAAARGAGRGVGQSFGAGIVAGLGGHFEEIKEQAREAVRQAESAARDEADSDSPSKLFARLGEDLIAGLALGMTEEQQVVAAAEQIVADAAAVFDGASLGALAVTGSTGGAAAAVGLAGAGAGAVNSFEFNVEVNVSGAVTTEQARQIGATIAQSAQQQLLQRRVVAQVRAVI